MFDIIILSHQGDDMSRPDLAYIWFDSQNTIHLSSIIYTSSYGSLPWFQHFISIFMVKDNLDPFLVACMISKSDIFLFIQVWIARMSIQFYTLPIISDILFKIQCRPSVQHLWYAFWVIDMWPIGIPDSLYIYYALHPFNVLPQNIKLGDLDD